METKIFQHLNPVWQDKANFIIAASVPPLKSDPDEIVWEQLWCRQISINRFEICCIPFFAYNLALGDEVETDLDYSITRVIKRSGHFTFRIWFHDETSEKNKNKVMDEIKELDCQLEWYSEKLIGIDAASKDKAQLLANLLARFQNDNLIAYETGKQ